MISTALTPFMRLCLSLYKSSTPSQMWAASCNSENKRAPLESVFLGKWDDDEEDIYAVITELAGYFRCGESVIARKALDCKKITKDIYNKIVQTAIDNYNQMKENREKSGGNYYNTMGSRLDGNFVKALCESISMGRTSYTEAYRLTNTSRKTFSEVAQHFGGMEW